MLIFVEVIYKKLKMYMTFFRATIWQVLLVGRIISPKKLVSKLCAGEKNKLRNLNDATSKISK